MKDNLGEKEPLFQDLDDLQEELSFNNAIAFSGLDRGSGAVRGRETEQPEGKILFLQNAQEDRLSCKPLRGTFTSPVDSSIMMRASDTAYGGYTSTLLNFNPSAFIDGVALPEESGGHAMLLPFLNEDFHVNVKFIDITMLISQY